MQDSAFYVILNIDYNLNFYIKKIISKSFNQIFYTKLFLKSYDFKTIFNSRKKESDLLNKNQEIPEYMYPQNDFIFKRLFGYEGNEEITKDLVSSIIGKPIKTLEFKNPYLLRETKDDKEEILDIKACLDNNIQCDIEIQVGNNHDVEKRILDSWSKMYR